MQLTSYFSIGILCLYTHARRESCNVDYFIKWVAFHFAEMYMEGKREFVGFRPSAQRSGACPGVLNRAMY